MIEITGNDIKELNDTDLRSLIGLLCEAELRAIGLSASGVTWGGDQNAKDGGVDVRVELTTTLSEDSFIPRLKTGFQVKKPDMPRAAIIKEMRQNGVLRQIIKDLADDEGAYIIVSSQSSTSDSALTSRKKAMQEALFDCSCSSNLKVDFYDRERIAGWVRSHPSLILWVRDKIGRSIQGWKAYGNWANSPGGVEDEYMLDGHIRLHNSVNPRSDGFSAIDGINELRTALQRSSSSVRLVGLSGVGKTRLLQALFDERIGQNPLNQSLAFYTDISDSPNPDPLNMAERLIALQKPAILIIDNCPPQLHRRLTSTCTAFGSPVSLITVEYDVRDDQPEETRVFRLEPASTELIEKVILARFNHVSKVDSRTIAEFSGGNARIAIALANTIKYGDNLAHLRDDELFSRLFQQRNDSNISLLRTAEICSLVYSFDCQTAVGSDTELKCLSSLIGIGVQELFENVSELKRRDLVQQRSIWRAVLPHAIANKLAKRALENIPLDNIYNVFEKDGSERLLKSFSKRLGYLYECDAAIEISRKWLSPNGLLGDISKLNELGISLFQNIAPINLELTLSAIERVSTLEEAQLFFSRENVHYNIFSNILKSLAYDKDLFERSTELLCRFALSENPNENIDSIRNKLKSLFYIYLSGTHATSEQRLKIIAKLIESNISKQIDLGITLLSTSLEAWSFSSCHNFEFGARSRNYGFSPRNREDIEHWFKTYIEYTASLAISDLPVSSKMKYLLAEKFRGLWIKAGMYDELELAAKEISKKCSWKEGFISVRTTQNFHGNEMDSNVLLRLNSLGKLLEPVNLIEKAKLYALSSNHGCLDLIDTLENPDEDLTHSYHKAETITRSLGCEVGGNEEIFMKLLPDILSKDGARLFSFGQGLADGCVDVKKMWQNFCDQLSLIEEPNRNYQVLRGFLDIISKKDTKISEELLNEAVTDSVLAIVFPVLQISVEISEDGVDRLKKSLNLGTAPIWYYKYLGYGRVHETITDNDLGELLRMISSKPEGITVAIDILKMRLLGHLDEDKLSPLIVSVGYELLLSHQFSRKDNRVSNMDYDLAAIFKACSSSKSAEKIARILCSRFVKAFANSGVLSITDYHNVLEAIAIKQPIAFLDTFLGEDVNIDHHIRRELSEESRPLSCIDDEIIINWCEVNPMIRYPLVASALVLYREDKDKSILKWTQLALRIINNCSDPIIVLNEFKSTLIPMSWSGSRAELMQKRLKLFSDLKEHENSLVSDWACKEKKVFAEAIRSEREWELKWESDQNERFE